MDRVDTYIQASPAAQRETLLGLRQMIRAALPEATEEMGSSGFPVYTVEGRWRAGFASRKKGAMLYVMQADLLDAYADRLGRLRSGNSCIEWRGTDKLSIEGLTELAREILDRLDAEPPTGPPQGA